MLHAIYPAPPQVAHLVRYFWILESSPFSSTPPKYLALADGSPELIFQCNRGFKEFTGPAHLVAQRSISKYRHLHGNIAMFGVRLYPCALRQITGVPSHELNETAYGLNELLGPDGVRLTEQVSNADNADERMELVSSFLMKAAGDRNTLPELIIKEMMHHNGNIDLDFMQHHTSLTGRQIQRIFKEYVGYPPKYFMRILRFQASWRRYISGKFKSLTELAYACGYADQSHFGREFKEFSGVSPRQYYKLLNQSHTEKKITKELIIAKDAPPAIH